MATRGISSLQYEVSKVTHNKTPSIKAVFANGTTQNIDAIKDKLQCNGTCTSELGTRSLAYTLEGLESASAVGDVLVSTEEELCYNEEDDDNDGTTDCLDNDCDSERGDISNANLLCNYGTERDCSDEFDNDKDSLTDCDDSDCSSDEACGPSYTDSCNSTDGTSSVCNQSGTCYSGSGCECGIYNHVNSGDSCDFGACSEKFVYNSTTHSNNRINYTRNPFPTAFTAEFDLKAWGGNGADGIYFYWYAKGTTAPTPGSDADSFPVGKYTNSDSDAYRVVFDEFMGNSINTYWNGNANTLNVSGSGVDLDDGAWRHAKIVVDAGHIQVYLDGTLKADFTDGSYSSRDKTGINFGLGGYIGGPNNHHAFKNFKF
ncbi:MAG: hypothetical protein EBU08_20415, partial [Micrococcales bacterium]|nr:hypothetical protein [Micrococcales bacterium]